MKKWFQCSAACLATLVLCGCNQVGGDRDHDVYAFCQDERFQVDVPKSLVKSGDELNVLVISGGASAGAWGAGVLGNWDAQPASPRRPKFDIVTAISAGALLATYAFLDQDADRQDVVTQFSTVKSGDIYHYRWTPLLYGDSLATTGPLRVRLGKIIDEKTLAAVAAEHRSGRRLYVGTVDLNTNTFCIWNMGALADSSYPKKLELYRQIILASASIPVFFNPTEIGGDLHVDGGARAGFFLRKDMIDGLNDYKNQQKYAKGNIYVLINGRIQRGSAHPVGFEPVSKPMTDSLFNVAMASVNNLENSNTRGQFAEIKQIAHDGNYKVYISAIPADSKFSLPANVFEPVAMSKLIDEARTALFEGKAWQEVTTTFKE